MKENLNKIDYFYDYTKEKNEIKKLIKYGSNRQEIAKYIVENSIDPYKLHIYTDKRKTFLNKNTQEFEIYYKDLIEGVIDNCYISDSNDVEEFKRLDKEGALCSIGIGIEENEFFHILSQNENLSNKEIFDLCSKWYYINLEDFEEHVSIDLKDIFDLDKYINELNILTIP